MDRFIAHINQYVELSSNAEKALRANLEIQRLAKGELLLEPGKVSDRMYFLLSGTARTFFYQDGKEITYWIYRDGMMVTSWDSYFLRQASTEFIEATETSEVISASRDQWQELFLVHRDLERYMREMIEQQLALLDHFYKGYYFLSAKQKYQLLLQTFPDIDQRANLGHIASMLGITQETLSRVRSDVTF